MSGEAPSKAALLKSISNTVVVNMIEATAEALVLADKTGLGATHMQRLAKELWPGPCAFYAERMAGNTYADGKVRTLVYATRALQLPQGFAANKRPS